jgi:glycosyltransferase involved in cell wall biosynthesis
MFETDRTPSGWELRLNSMDEVWVPTHFQKEVFVEGGVDRSKVYVVPEPVDVSFFDPQIAAAEEALDWTTFLEERSEGIFAAEACNLNALQGESTVFLSVFKWEARKGWDVLLKAYFAEFLEENRKKVCLVLLSNPYHGTNDFEGEIARFAMEHFKKELDDLPPVQVLQSGLPATVLRALYHRADAFVLPSHGEGWGRPHVEAMSMELPVVATHWSGPTEYMTPTNSFPLEIEGMEVVPDGAFKGHMWASPSLSNLRQHLRHIVSDPQEAKVRGHAARRDMITKYAPQVLAQTIRSHLARIQSYDNDELPRVPAGSPRRKNEL